MPNNHEFPKEIARREKGVRISLLIRLLFFFSAFELFSLYFYLYPGILSSYPARMLAIILGVFVVGPLAILITAFAVVKTKKSGV